MFVIQLVELPINTFLSLSSLSTTSRVIAQLLLIPTIYILEKQMHRELSLWRLYVVLFNPVKISINKENIHNYCDYKTIGLSDYINDANNIISACVHGVFNCPTMVVAGQNGTP